jgi:predicted PurR-regulated permease PerM
MTVTQQNNRIESIARRVIITLIVIGCLVVLRPFMSALAWAAILCFCSWPFYLRLEKWFRGRKEAAAAVMTALVALVMVVPFVIVGLSFAENIAHLLDRISAIRAEGLPPAPEWLAQIPLVGDMIQKYWSDLAANTDTMMVLIKKIIVHSRTWMLARGLNIAEGIFQLSLSVMMAFFFYLNGDRITVRIREAGKRILGDYGHHLITVTGQTVKGVVYGILGTALAQGILAGVGFWVVGVPSAFLLGLLTFFLSMIPFGPPLVWIPVTIWVFLSGHMGWGIFMALWGFLIISGVDNIIRPYLISRGANLPFVLVLLGVLGGLLAFGFIGIFLGPTLLAIGYSLAREFLRSKPDGTPPADG